MIKKHNIIRWFNRLQPLIYIFGFLTAREFGYGLEFLLISTILLGVIYWKPLWNMMNQWGELYADKVQDMTGYKKNRRKK